MAFRPRKVGRRNVVGHCVPKSVENDVCEGHDADCQRHQVLAQSIGPGTMAFMMFSRSLVVDTPIQRLTIESGSATERRAVDGFSSSRT
jgi:hypothetical protein